MDPYSTQLLILNQLGHLSGTFLEHIILTLKALAFLVIGLITAQVVKYISMVLLRLLRWNQFSAWIGLTRVLQKVRADVNSSAFTGEVLFWLTLVSFFMKSLIITGINSFSWMGRVYFDNLGAVFQALLIMLTAMVVSQWMAKLVLLLVENAAALFASGVARMLGLSLGLNAALLALGMEQRFVWPLVLILFGGVMLALAWHGAGDRGICYRRVIRVEDYEEGV